MEKSVQYTYINRKLKKHSTIKNKIMGILLVLLGIISTLITKEATALAIFLILGIPLIFAKQNWID